GPPFLTNNNCDNCESIAGEFVLTRTGVCRYVYSAPLCNVPGWPGCGAAREWAIVGTIGFGGLFQVSIYLEGVDATNCSLRSQVTYEGVFDDNTECRGELLTLTRFGGSINSNMCTGSPP